MNRSDFQKSVSGLATDSASHRFNSDLRIKHTFSEPQKSKAMTSRIPGFYALTLNDRIALVKEFSGLSDQEAQWLLDGGKISNDLSDTFIENAISSFSLPIGIATNFLINGKELLVPMVVEESSVLAAASHAAKMIRMGGGFFTQSTDPVMTGQIQLFIPDDHMNQVDQILRSNQSRIIDYANMGQERLLARGGGAKSCDWHFIPELKAVVIHLYINTGDAMGANIINSMCERVSGIMPELFPCDIGLRILTNLNDHRLAIAECQIPADAFTTPAMNGDLLVDRIEKAYLFAYYDKYRATTNNKGVMNGIDSVLIATGNDWRAVEAGAHAYASRDGNYRPMAVWKKQADGSLSGRLELPMAVGTVGGVTKLHPTAQIALKILGYPGAQKLAEIVVAAGLAQNLAALRALAAEGIQKGHMSLHQKNLDLLERAAKP